MAIFQDRAIKYWPDSPALPQLDRRKRLDMVKNRFNINCSIMERPDIAREGTLNYSDQRLLSVRNKAKARLRLRDYSKVTILPFERMKFQGGELCG
jgi:hypothetical protein